MSNLSRNAPVKLANQSMANEFAYVANLCSEQKMQISAANSVGRKFVKNCFCVRS